MSTAHRPTPDADPFRSVLLRAQVAAYSRQVPLLYAMLCMSSFAVAAVHYGVAPIALVVAAPAVLLTFCAVRFYVWRRRRERVPGAEEARRMLRSANVIGPVLGLCFLVWAIALFGYGDAFQKAHVIFFCGFTVLGCIFCQMHVRTAALGVTLTIIPALTVFLLLQGQPTLAAIALNLAAVCVAMVRMLLVHSSSFDSMVALQAETERLSEENRRLALADSLTGLPNRRLFFEAIEKRAASDPARRSCVIGLIDLDGFKPVNDLHGHATGDRVLVEIGRRLQSLEIEHVSFARLGGDEFGVFVDVELDQEATLQLGERICDALGAPVALEGVLIELSASIGFAASRDELASIERLYERADYALYHAKHHRRGRTVLFSAEHETAIRRVGLIEQALRRADLAEEMSLLFQPVVDVAARQTVAFEALARWRCPDLGAVSPAEFIPIAERTDLINRVTRTLLAKALDVAETLPPGMRVSFNLSARDLTPEAILGIVHVVQASRVSPSRLAFEVTETAAMRDFAVAEGALATLRALGAKIALDDFGSGYSSLNAVRRLTLDAIKVDRGFSVDIERDETARDIVKTVIDLCRNLKLGCVVEGVETEGQARILRSLGCTAIQGYLYSKPLSAAEIPAYLERETRQTIPGRVAAPA
ncbi:MAG: GGDEF-domain containing protein [Ancylobacter novellus]|uniref:GGDEF-domain containing protein n=1 Tax=Ancylobacter novellus TaxID=921 RepID=A0A2W5KNX3_ANCNO|nr:MAG: GGDEF-domain containing protein [Ancylobacter novellus]